MPASVAAIADGTAADVELIAVLLLTERLRIGKLVGADLARVAVAVAVVPAAAAAATAAARRGERKWEAAVFSGWCRGTVKPRRECAAMRDGKVTDRKSVV